MPWFLDWRWLSFRDSPSGAGGEGLLMLGPNPLKETHFWESNTKTCQWRCTEKTCWGMSENKEFTKTLWNMFVLFFFNETKWHLILRRVYLGPLFFWTPILVQKLSIYFKPFFFQLGNMMIDWWMHWFSAVKKDVDTNKFFFGKWVG